MGAEKWFAWRGVGGRWSARMRKKEEELKPFLDHLEDFRWMIIKSLVAIGLGMLVSFPLAPGILSWLERPLIRHADELAQMAATVPRGAARQPSDEYVALAERVTLLESRLAQLSGTPPSAPTPAPGTTDQTPPAPAPGPKPEKKPTASEIAARYFISTGPAEPFILLLKLSGWAGLIFSLPFVLYFIAEFVFPGLTQKERRLLLPLASAGFFLFLLGLSFCYWLTLPQAMRVMLGVHRLMGVGVAWKLPEYIKFVTQLLLAFGVAFEMPMVILALVKLGLVSSAALRSKRRHVIVGIFIVAMILTPPDVYTQVMLAIPMCVLYEICILLARVIEKREAAAWQDEDDDEAEEEARAGKGAGKAAEAKPPEAAPQLPAGAAPPGTPPPSGEPPADPTG